MTYYFLRNCGKMATREWGAEKRSPEKSSRDAVGRGWANHSKSFAFRDVAPSVIAEIL